MENLEINILMTFNPKSLSYTKFHKIQNGGKGSYNLNILISNFGLLNSKISQLESLKPLEVLFFFSFFLTKTIFCVSAFTCQSISMVNTTPELEEKCIFVMFNVYWNSLYLTHHWIAIIKFILMLQILKCILSLFN